MRTLFCSRAEPHASTIWVPCLALLLACSDGDSPRAPAEPDRDESTSVQDNVNEAVSDAALERDATPSEDVPDDDDEALLDAGHASESGDRAEAGAIEHDAHAPADAGEPADADDTLADAEISNGQHTDLDAAPTTDAAISDSGTPAEDAATADAQRDASGPLCTQCGACEQTIPVTNADHRPEPVTYTDVPPAGGLHAACWISFGVHAQEEPAGRWVHNQEHGAVVFLYNCPEGCPDEVRALEALVPGRPFAIVVPYSAMATRFAVTSWGHRIVSECLDIAAFEDFYARYANMGRESRLDPPADGC
jgi:hypothetical protein